MLISESYRSQLEQMHAEKSVFGAGSFRHANVIEEIADDLGARVILDYGAGKQTMAKAIKSRTVISYDPAIPEISASPEPADLVVCTDVMEHIEPECLDEVLSDIKRCALKAALFTVCTEPAHKHLPDGRNAHLIVEPAEWWVRKLMEFFRPLNFQAGDNGIMFLGK